MTAALRPIYEKAYADAGIETGKLRASVVQMVGELCDITEDDVPS